MKPPSIEKARRTGAGKWEFWAGGQSSTASRNCECDRGSGARTEAAQKWPRSWLREREREREREAEPREACADGRTKHSVLSPESRPLCRPHRANHRTGLYQLFEVTAHLNQSARSSPGIPRFPQTIPQLDAGRAPRTSHPDLL